MISIRWRFTKVLKFFYFLFHKRRGYCIKCRWAYSYKDKKGDNVYICYIDPPTVVQHTGYDSNGKPYNYFGGASAKTGKEHFCKRFEKRGKWVW